MTDASAPKPPLGVGTLISASFRTYLGNFVPFFLAVALLMFINLAITVAMRPVVPAGMSEDEIMLLMAEQGLGAQLASTGLGVLMMAVMAAALTRMTAEVAAGRRARLFGAFAGLGRTILPLAVLFFVCLVIFMIGFVVLVVPGLWFGAAAFVMGPAIVIGGAGFGGLGRSWRLTKGYRWPIIGLLILLMVIMMLAMSATNLVMALMLGAGSFTEFAAASATAGLGTMAVSTILGMAFYPILFIAPALTYLRLVRIKDGDDPETLTEVFA